MGQQALPITTIPERVKEDSIFRVVFWNVENFFHPDDNPLTNDEAFTPQGENQWSLYRYYDKRNNIAKTLTATGGWVLPDIIFLAEVEEKEVLEDIADFSSFQNTTHVIHTSSRDNRGIDVGALVNHEVSLLKTQYIQHPDSTLMTRDVLYITVSLFNTDTLHLFANHWPSRYGGRSATVGFRQEIAAMLRDKIDSLQLAGDSLIAITGDFNDYPTDESMILLAGNDMINFMDFSDITFGTHSFEGKWGNLDQWLVSKTLLEKYECRVYIFNAAWLLKNNATGGLTTNRTYQGPAYLGGYSDHLPVILDIARLPR